MIGLNFVFEKEELLYSLKLSTSVDKKYSLDYFDFDTQSFEDLIDYLKFLEFDKYIFVSLAENHRLKCLSSYLQEQLDLEIEVWSIDKLNSYFEIQNLQEIEEEIKSNDLYQRLLSLNTENILKNGYKAFKTGIYPRMERGLLKHLQVDYLDKFLTENSDLLRHLAINSAIYTSEKNNVETLPYIVKRLADFKMNQLEILNSEQIEEMLQTFIQTGNVGVSNQILDYGTLLGISNFNSLYFQNGQFYLDAQSCLKIGSSGDSFYQLVNQASLRKSERETVTEQMNLEYLFPILLDIVHAYGKVTFITPYNNYKLKAVNLPFEQLSWIAFKSGEQCFAFNIRAGRLFKVNELVIECLEAIIKGYGNENQNQEMKQVKEMLQLYG